MMLYFDPTGPSQGRRIALDYASANFTARI
jgi:hypothetical protein